MHQFSQLMNILNQTLNDHNNIYSYVLKNYD